jgi:hypothetical protein
MNALPATAFAAAGSWNRSSHPNIADGDGTARARGRRPGRGGGRPPPRRQRTTLPPRQKRPFHRLQDRRKAVVSFQSFKIFHAIAAGEVQKQHRQHHLQVQPALKARHTNKSTDRPRQPTLLDQVEENRQTRKTSLSMARTLRIILEIQHTL